MNTYLIYQILQKWCCHFNWIFPLSLSHFSVYSALCCKYVLMVCAQKIKLRLSSWTLYEVFLDKTFSEYSFQSASENFQKHFCPYNQTSCINSHLLLLDISFRSSYRCAYKCVERLNTNPYFHILTFYISFRHMYLSLQLLDG